MSKDNARKKEKSIARRIYAMLVGKLFLAFLFTDLLVISGVTVGYIEYQSQTLEDCSILDIDKIDMYNFTHRTQVLKVIYDSGQEYLLDVTLPLRLLSHGTVTLLSIQGILLLFALCFDYYRVKGRLRPLAQIARDAENISQMTFDGSRLQELEYAISHVSPVASEAQVRTNDRDLQGIETALNSLLERMRDAYRQQGRFVSDASHELRTPIAVIKGYVDMLDRWGADDPQVLSESIAAIKNETNHMNRLVEQLLFLARGDSGRNPIAMENFSLSQMVSEVYEEALKDVSDILLLHTDAVILHGKIRQILGRYADAQRDDVALVGVFGSVVHEDTQRLL